MTTPEGSSHKQIIKSTGIVGMSQVLTILIGIFRTKIIAVLLGPEGVGIVGMYQTTLTFIQSATGFGLGFSGVRDVAEASGTGDESRISSAIRILKRWAWITGTVGFALTLIFSRTLSRITFGDYSYAWGFALLSVTLFLASLSGAQLALLQGLRKITMMAKANVLGIFFGFLISVPLYYFLGNRGIVLALLASGICSLAVSWWYAKKIKLNSTHITYRETFIQGQRMIRLGFFTVLATMASTGTMFLVRVYILDQSDVQTVGIFQASWNLSIVYIAAILGAMGADYFPRLSEVSTDNEKIIRLANEQTEIAILASAPVMVAFLAFCPFIIRLFYSSSFDPAIPILQWQIPGTFLKVISWPLAYILMAKGKGMLYVTGEVVFNIVFLAIVYFGWHMYSLEITGIGFLVAYAMYLGFILVAISRAVKFRFNRTNLGLIGLFTAIISSSFIIVTMVHGTIALLLMLLILAGTCAVVFLRLRRLIDLKSAINSIKMKLK